MGLRADEANGGVCACGEEDADEGGEEGEEVRLGCYGVDGDGVNGGFDDFVLGIAEDAGGVRHYYYACESEDAGDYVAAREGLGEEDGAEDGGDEGDEEADDGCFA